MAVLSDTDRADTWADLMRDLSADHETVPIAKADLRAAVDALDEYLNTNASVINAALPQPARSALTIPQKARLLTFVVHKRYIAGS